MPAARRDTDRVGRHEPQPFGWFGCDISRYFTQRAQLIYASESTQTHDPGIVDT